ncbi:hypothetical protein BpHYR1_024901 [Brachionus plicatilis]|uniref:Uncharacterized protein n=1 Tax=Brachionus plicatilis TaxID=10195 RepID=A0A3M7QA30_BRAPC|nr:hypothetical protein BpHYR1_024901 [Brachionus plicatilis]
MGFRLGGQTIKNNLIFNLYRQVAVIGEVRCTHINKCFCQLTKYNLGCSTRNMSKNVEIMKFERAAFVDI